MAVLSNELKYKVIFALCHNGRIIDETSMHFNSIIRDRLGKSLDPFVVERVEFLTSEIEKTDEILRKAPAKANLRRIGDIELDNSGGIPLIQTELRRLKTELSQLLDIPNQCKGGSSVCVVF
jgi:uncharacterized small protein (DUF1192 family)